MEHIDVDEMARPLGPYSHAKRVGSLVFCAGHLALDRDTARPLAELDAGAQTAEVLRNLAATLAAAGASLGDVARTTVYLTDLAHYDSVNRAYADAFGAHRPARATVQVSRLLGGLVVEIDAIAELTG